MSNKIKSLALITINQVDLGIRLLSGVLRDAGYKVRLISLATSEDKWLHHYPDQVKKELGLLLADYDLIGISTVDMFLHRAEDLILWLSREMGKPILLGGNHVELNPVESIEIPGVSAICIGQGIHTIVDLCKNWGTQKAAETVDFWVRTESGEINRNPILPPLNKPDYADLPLPDYSYDDYWYLDKTSIRRMKPLTGPITIEQHQIGHPNSYVVSFSQGCINRCDFCHIASLTRNYREHGHPKTPWLRCKPLERIIEEFREVKRHNPNMEFIVFMDNNFAAHPTATLKGLAEFMHREIQLPFYCMATPNALNERKLQHMIDAGLRELNMGVESNAAINRKYYNRDIDDSVVLRATRLINKHKNRLHPFYDFLIFNPVESLSDVIETIQLVRQLPLPFDLVTHHLTVAPTLPLHKTLLNEIGRLPRSDEKLYESNWHDANPREYLDYPAFFVNLLMEWMAGPHTMEMIGRLPRKLNDFRIHTLGKQIRTGHPQLGHLLNDTDATDTLDWLLDSEICTLLSGQKQLLLNMHDSLPPVMYTNQIAGYQTRPEKQGII